MTLVLTVTTFFINLKFDPAIIIAGVATHSLDYKKSAGGFIHGYRYTGKLLV